MSKTFNIVSWNAQGNGFAKICSTSGGFIVNNTFNIFLIQEAGNETGTFDYIMDSRMLGRKNFNSIFVRQQDVKNKRCTVGILVQADIDNAKLLYIDSSDAETVRPIVYCTINVDGTDIVIATMHAISCHHLSKYEIDNAIKTISGISPYWILMGDFNCNAFGYRPNEIQSDFIKDNPGCSTQLSGGVLDYCFYSETLKDCVTHIQVGLPNKPDYVPSDSDHATVYTTLTFKDGWNIPKSKGESSCDEEDDSWLSSDDSVW